MPWGQAAAESRANGVPQACSFIAALSYPAQRPLERLLNQRRREVEGGLLSRNTAIRGAPALLGTGMYIERGEGAKRSPVYFLPCPTFASFPKPTFFFFAFCPSFVSSPPAAGELDRK